MTFHESIAVCFTKYADFNGRASRPEYWWFFLFTFAAGIVFGVFSDKLATLFHLASLLPGLAVGARRLHETNRSGWLQLLWLVPIVGWIIIIIFLAAEAKEPNEETTRSVDA
jgi:uncharacterized membrane protein YhaH (DUF805 family)